MSLAHSDVLPFDSLYVHPFGLNSFGWQTMGEALSAPTSLAWPLAHRAMTAPVQLNRPYPIARWFWANGATVGTNTFQVALYDENFRFVAASKTALSAGTINALQYTTPGISVGPLFDGNSSTDAASYVTANVDLKAGRMYTVTVENSHGTSASAVSAITGSGGPTFTSRATVQFNGTLNRVSLWTAAPTSDWSGTLTIAFGGVTQTGAVWTVSEARHVDTATNDGIVQTATATGNSTAPIATLAAFGSVENGTLAVAGVNNSGSVTQVGSYVPVGNESAATPTQALGVAFRSDNDTTAETLVVTGQWGAIGAEIKSKGPAAIWVPAGRYHMAMAATGATATVFRKNNWTEAAGVYIQAWDGAWVPQTLTPIGLQTGHSTPVFGFTRRASP